ncbi:MAG: class I SAM-dependent methyltransferase [Anaerolineae bacterium]
MPQPMTYDFVHYLEAKRTVDDRALNRHVWRSLSRAVADLDRDAPLEVLEIGAGIGTMLERTIEWGLFPGDVVYTAFDALPENITEAGARLQRWASKHGFEIAEQGGDLVLMREGQTITARLEAVDLFTFIHREQPARSWDLLIAHAFLDLMDIPAALPGILSLLRPDGLFYFSINFDGQTILEPVLDADFDAHVEALYHRTMDERMVGGKPSGDSQAGRHLFGHLKQAGCNVLDAGSSDWVVFAGPGGYPADEAYFLQFIIHTIDTALRHHPDLGDPARFADWVAARHRQVERGELVYIAHQLDFVGRAPSSG